MTRLSSESAVRSRAEAVKASRTLDYMILFTAFFVILGGYHIHYMLTGGDWDFWTDWKDRRLWATVAPIVSITFPAAVQACLWYRYRLPFGAVVCVLGLLLGEWINRYMNFWGWTYFPINFCFPSNLMPGAIVLDIILMLSNSMTLTAVVGGMAWGIMFYPSNWPIIAPLHIPVEYNGMMFTLADLQGYHYVRTGTPEYIRMVEKGTLRTFGKDVAPVSAFFSGFVSILIYFLWHFFGKWFGRTTFVETSPNGDLTFWDSFSPSPSIQELPTTRNYTYTHLAGVAKYLAVSPQPYINIMQWKSKLDLPLEKVQADKAPERTQAHTALPETVNNTLSEPEMVTSKKTINAWIEECKEAPDEPLVLGNLYTLSFKVGQAIDSNLLSGQNVNVAMSDIPLAGLLTHWVVMSESVELSSISPNVRISTWPEENPCSWTARFTLPVVRDRESDVVQLGIIPQKLDGARLKVLIDVNGDPWRDFFVDLVTVLPDLNGAPPITSASMVSGEVIHTRDDQLNLAPPHEWQTPPGILTLRIHGGGRIDVLGYARENGAFREIDRDSRWGGNREDIANLISALHLAAEGFRGAEQTYLNDIDHENLNQRLAQFTPIYDWDNIPDDLADEQHRDAWKRVASSDKLRELAKIGYALYQRCFPNRTDEYPDYLIRGWLDSLPSGYRLNIRWTTDDPNSVPHMPWGLMYMRDPDLDPYLPIDPFAFMGMRFRINYVKRNINALRSLGRPETTYRAHCLYWGTDAGDTAIEASFQSKLWSGMAPQVVILGVPASADPRADLLRFLADPQPPPMPILYIFCECTFEDHLPKLWFGLNESQRDVINILKDAPRGLLRDRPLIFVNACATSAASPYSVNELEKYFFDRNARAFLGTETLVPVQFASRFASVFFHFFYRQVADRAPIAAGEAISQTRLFLWSHYRNIGGILYSYVNQFDLYMANDDEIKRP